MLVHGPYPIGEPRVEREAVAAREEGFDVEVIAMRRSEEPRETTIDDIRVIRLPLSRHRGARFAGTVLEYLAFTLMASFLAARRHFRRRYDVIQVHNPPDFLVVAAIVPKLRGARVVLDIHDLSSHMFGARFRGGRAVPLAQSCLRGIQLLATRLADAVLTVHEPYKRELASQGVDPNKITVVMNSVDERLLPARPGPTGDGPLRIVYHGTLTGPYGLDVLVAAAARLRDIGLTFTVELYGEGDALDDIRASLASAGLSDRFSISESYLPQAEVLSRIAGASVGVVPNVPSELNRFALSSKLFEYVALGIPVVSADLPTIREHFSDAEVKFFRAGDPDSLANALAEVAAAPGPAVERAGRALRRYEQYRWSGQAEQYVGLLGQLARESPRPS